MTTPARPAAEDVTCSCGRPGCNGNRAVDIVVGKRQLRRAMAAAEQVNDEAMLDDGPEAGVIFMTALLLVERLAESLDCAPHAVLQEMAHSFELKRRYLAESKARN